MGLPNIGPLELIIILAIALLIIGPGRLPEMGNAIGRTIREFRNASSDVTGATSLEPATPAKSEASTSASSATDAAGADASASSSSATATDDGAAPSSTTAAGPDTSEDQPTDAAQKA